MSNILLTGAGGILGREILLHAKEHEDLTFFAVSSQIEKLQSMLNTNSNIVFFHTNDLKKCFRTAKFNTLIHAAFPRSYSGSEMAKGLKYFVDILDMAKSNNIKSIINISSQSVYDPKRVVAADEDATLVLDTNYAVGKYATELMVNSLHYSIPTTNLRMASLIAPNFDQRLVNKLVAKTILGEDITITDGRQQFGFLDVYDAANGILCVSKSVPSEWDTTYNLGTNESHSLADIVNIVCNIASTLGLPPIRINKIKADLWQNSSLNCRKICRHFGWQAQRTLEESIKIIFEQKLNNM